MILMDIITCLQLLIKYVICRKLSVIVKREKRIKIAYTILYPVYNMNTGIKLTGNVKRS
jgi:hypothetical protein